MSSDALDVYALEAANDRCLVQANAVVVAIESTWVWVKAEPTSACTSCAASSGCGAGLLASLNRKNDEHRLLCLPNTFHARVGENIVIGLEGQSLLKAGAMAYLVPALTTVLGAIVGSVHGEIMVVLGAVGGLAAGIGLLAYQFGNAKPDMQRDDIAEITFVRRGSLGAGAGTLNPQKL